MLRRPSRRAQVPAVALALIFLLPQPALAHAMLESSAPTGGATVEGSPSSVVVTFTEPITNQSTLELRDAGGTVVGTGGVDPSDATRLRLATPDLQPGAYEARVVWFSTDGHGPDRATFAFTVAPAPAPTPSPTPSPTVDATATPSAAPTENEPSPTLAPSPSPDPGPGDDAAATDVVIPIVAAVILLGALGGYLLRRRSAGA